MKTLKTPKILFFGLDHSICAGISCSIEELGLCARADIHPGPGDPPIHSNGYDIIVVDLDMVISRENPGFMEAPQGNGSFAKILAVSEQGADAPISDLLRPHVFDWIEKPIKADLLLRRVVFALQFLERELRIERMADELNAFRSGALSQNSELEPLRNQLLDTKKALSVLAHNIHTEREDVEKQIALKLRSLVIPAVDKLKNMKGLAPYSAEIKVISTLIEHMTSDFIVDARIASILTTAELRVASLIKNGLSTDDIARQLNVTPGTVRTHRKRIRKKLNIAKASYSLNNFLISQVEGSKGRNGED